MTFETLTALAIFAFVSSATPGPNNLMLMASGANFGFLRTIPHMLGISIGFMVMLFSVGAGLVQIFDRYPVIYDILKVGSVIYMLWLAWKIAHAAPVTKNAEAGAPMTFLQAAAFQWVNPKAWAMALTAITVYVGDAAMIWLGVGALMFAIVNLPSVSMWTIAGQQLQRFLTNPRRLRAYNWTMAALLIASLYPVLQT
ncbi:LysE family translocator [Sulfitobacter donghicola]|uniref:Lysine transporter LysE n=1 Tax=Sulfitobacter donghicola DSW-25 = KCTC 12864 = JCM 14565 TaxID=1300350 RepID=A0A073IMT6_9RHOB|nr:LysE family translocator [Sulfitobacter donghicola]KEJ90900.1 lysine transporter LysE [Sulfitobacter donghicola DSW-25 = KCTC 12864 = JCM 14565]KIN68183.1 Lysine exporter protein [Sulfitobacter donghicola DSW-25 = KCTC 12864 = JCM 14565]